MAAVTLLGSVTFNTNAGNKTVTATPAAGDLLVVFVAHSGTTTFGNVTDNQGGTYSKIDQANRFSNGAGIAMFVRDSLVSSAVSHTITTAPTASNGGGLAVFKVTGMSKVGLAAILQSAKQENQTTNTTPAPVFGATPQSTNPVIGGTMQSNNPAAISPRTGYTERFDTGYSTPNVGVQGMTRDSGETSATISWGSTTGGTDWCAMVVELDASASAIPKAYGFIF